MKVTNRILSSVAAVCMASTVLLYPGNDFHGKYSNNVSAAENAEAYTEADFLKIKYKELPDGTVEITGYEITGYFYEPLTDIDIKIPSVIDGKKVTAIGYEAFVNCNELGSITIPDGVTSIGDGAFWIVMV